VLMLGYMNQQALEETFQNQRVTFFSRSRNQLWQKGKTSGNTLQLVSVTADCDKDALLVLAHPEGPTCHFQTRSCFQDAPSPDLSWLGELDRIIERRSGADPEQSYTAKLLSGPMTRMAQKVGEEGVEVALAALGDDPNAVIDEAADLMFHLMVVLQARGLGLEQVAATLRSRHEDAE